MTDDPRLLLASEDGLVAPLSGSECIFQLRHTGDNHVMTYQVLKAMDACRQFKTLDEHIQMVAQTQPELREHPQAIKQVLENLVKRQLFTSAEGFAEEVFGGTSPEQDSALAGVLVRTKDRPAHLKSLLDSAAALEQAHGNGRRFLVVDDSAVPDCAQENERLVNDFEQRTAGGARYLGRQWRAELTEKMVSLVPGAEASVRWLLGPAEEKDVFTGGQGWNAALLATAGQRLLMFDDDFLLAARRPPNAAEHQLQLMPDAASRYAQFYPSREHVLEAGDAVTEDPLAIHERLCGAPVSGLLDRMDLELMFGDLRQRDLKSLRQHLAGAQIKTTHMGTYGHSGAGSNAWVYLVPPAARAQLWESEAAYRAIMSEQWVMRGVSHPKISAMGVYAPVAIDNATLTPFAAPTERGEDFHFASMLKFLYPNSVDYEVPWMMCHLRPDGGLTPKPMALTPPLSRFVGDFTSGLRTDCHALKPEDRYRFAAAALRDQAAAPSMARQRVLREYLSSARARLINQMNQVLMRAEAAPDYWTADLKQLVETNGTALLGDATPKLRGWHRETSARGCADRLTRELVQHAEAMEIWPTLWEAGLNEGSHWLDR